MKTSIRFATAIILLVPSTNNAFGKSESTDSVKIFKNEIGINVTPVASVVLGNAGDMLDLSIIWKKRFQNDHTFLRFRPAVLFYNNEGYNEEMPKERRNPGVGNQLPPKYYGTNYDLISQTASTQLRIYKSNSYAPAFKLHAGLEKRFGKRKLSWFCGAEVFAGIQKTLHAEKQFLFVLGVDSSNNALNYSPDFSSSYTHEILNTTERIIIAGISPVFGCRINITKRLILSGELNPEFALWFHKSKTIYANGVSSENTSATSGFDMDTGGNIGSVLLCYSFGKTAPRINP